MSQLLLQNLTKIDHTSSVLISTNLKAKNISNDYNTSDNSPKNYNFSSKSSCISHSILQKEANFETASKVSNQTVKSISQILKSNGVSLSKSK